MKLLTVLLFGLSCYGQVHICDPICRWKIAVDYLPQHMLTGDISTGTAPGTTAEQEAYLRPILWSLQKKAGLESIYIRLVVHREIDMSDKMAWGSEAHAKSGGVLIEVLDANDYPEQMPVAEVIAHQKLTVLHEVCHILFTKNGVPDEMQDDLIDVITPLLDKNFEEWQRGVMWDEINTGIWVNSFADTLRHPSKQ